MEYTEEEKKAIVKLAQEIEIIKKILNSSNDKEEGINLNAAIELTSLGGAIEIVLNLIEKHQKEIKKYKNMYEKEHREHFLMIRQRNDLEKQNLKLINSKIGVDLSFMDYIPKEAIREKIKEYDNKIIKMEKDDIGVGFTLGKKYSDLKAKIQVLKELLGE